MPDKDFLSQYKTLLSYIAMIVAKKKCNCIDWICRKPKKVMVEDDSKKLKMKSWWGIQLSYMIKEEVVWIKKNGRYNSLKYLHSHGSRSGPGHINQEDQSSVPY